MCDRQVKLDAEWFPGARPERGQDEEQDPELSSEMGPTMGTRIRPWQLHQHQT
jgi:hypothetical protein